MEFPTIHDFPSSGISGKIYVDTNTNLLYRWTGLEYLEVSESLKLGESSTSAYWGDKGKIAYTHSQINGNPHSTTKNDIGLSNVPNVSTNNQTPTYTDENELTSLSSGETLTIAFGKISKAIKDFMSHIIDNIKHITPSERTFWNNKASTDIVSTNNNGLAPKLSGNATHYLNGNGQYTIPPDTIYNHPSSHPANIIVQDSQNRFVADNQILNWNDKYTQNEVDNKINNVVSSLDWKESVNSYANISTTYPNPEDGWTVNVKDTDITYRYNGSSWIPISANAIPLATTSVDGKMSSTDKIKLDGISLGANNYLHPSGDGNSHVPVTGTSNNTKVLKAGSTVNSATWSQVLFPEIGSKPTTLSGYGITDATPSSHVGTTGTAHGIATTLVNGFMSSTDKIKVDGIANNANNYSHPVNHPPSIITQDSNNRFVTDSQITNWNAGGSAANGVTGVKGSSEGSYRTGQVNLTAANVGAAASSHAHSIANVTNLQSSLDGKAGSSHTHNYAGSGSAGGVANSATVLATSRTIQTNLASTNTASFNGGANVTPGVTGVLGIANGGTGANSASNARAALGITEAVNTAVSNAISGGLTWGQAAGK